MKKKLLVSLVFIVAALFIVSLGSAQAAPKRFVSIASGWVTGAYFPFAGAVSRVAGKDLASQGVKVTAESSGASVANAKLLGTGDTDFALLQNDIASYAYNGFPGMFDKPIKTVRGCMTLYPETIQIVARKDSNIKSVADLKGKKVAVGPVGSGTTENAKQILEAWGLGLSDMESQQLKSEQAADYMKDGRIDAYFNTTAVGAAHIIDTFVLVSAMIVPIEGPNVEKLIKKYPFYTDQVVPKTAYKGMDGDVNTVAVMAMFATRSDLETDLVYGIVKSVYTNIAQVRQAHAQFAKLDVKNALKGMSVPLHPGAEKYFKEVGLIK